jgi:hypothetical protein
MLEQSMSRKELLKLFDKKCGKCISIYGNMCWYHDIAYISEMVIIRCPHKKIRELVIRLNEPT